MNYAQAMALAVHHYGRDWYYRATIKLHRGGFIVSTLEPVAPRSR